MSFNKMQKQSRSEIETKVKTLEAMLSEDYTKYAEVTETEEAALEDRRVGDTDGPLEFTMEKGRKGADEGISEARLETGKQKVGADRRNPEAHQGDVPVLEKQRLSGDKNPVMEKEKYKKATD